MYLLIASGDTLCKRVIKAIVPGAPRRGSIFFPSVDLFKVVIFSLAAMMGVMTWKEETKLIHYALLKE